VSVGVLGICPDTNYLIVPFPSVDEFMASYFIDTIKVGPLKTEEEMLPISLWLKLEPVHVNIHFVAEYNKGPEPSCSFN